jgi:hypothetical protein
MGEREKSTLKTGGKAGISFSAQNHTLSGDGKWNSETEKERTEGRHCDVRNVTKRSI